MSDILHLPPIPASILGISDVSIEKAEINNSGEFIIKVKSTKTSVLCRKCKKPTDPNGHGRTIQLRHLPIFGHQTYIEIAPARGICRSCAGNPTTTETSNWYNSGSCYTKAYEQHILFSLINSTISDVSIKENIGYKSIESVVDRYVQTKVNWESISAIGLLGIDEISLKKGYKDYVTILTSRSSSGNQIIGVIKGREKSAIKEFLASIPSKLRKTIEAVCSDMYDGFINAAKEVFGSDIPIIADRYHVSKLYRKSLVSLRKKELKKLKKSLTKEEYHILKPAISLLCKRKEYSITEEEKKILEPLFEKAPKLKEAYTLCIQLTAIYNRHCTQEEASSAIDEWVKMVERSKVGCFKEFIKILRKYQKEICNYFINRNSSGFVEGLNNKIKVLKRRCYGIFNLDSLFQRVFLDFSGYKFLRNLNVTKM